VSIRRWLGLTDQPSAPSVDSLVEIERALENLDPARARYLACFAYILSRAARADHAISDVESRVMETIVTERGGIPLEQARVILKIAQTTGLRAGGTDDFLVTREFDRVADRPGKLALLECLFAVSASDQSIGTVEDNEIRRIATELKLEHTDFIAARVAHLRHFEVLRNKKEGDTQ